jgi:LPPG:FO 2-phospho-L-lactate transferase
MALTTIEQAQVVALAGGVGGAKLAHGLALCLAPERLTVVVNTGDDFEHLGLHVSPDLDTVMYTLAGLANPATGWGRVDETWDCLEAVRVLGGPDWFALGDRDLATHLVRTQRLRAGQRLSAVTQGLARALGVGPALLPMTDAPVRTVVATDEGELAFQDYFVARRCQPRVTGFRFAGIETAQPAPEVMAALAAADIVVLCPSNPFVSTAPILALPGVRAALAACRERGGAVVAVSPIVAGQALKGPAAKMLAELGLEVSALAVARAYAGIITGFVLDSADASLEQSICDLGLQVLVTDTIMRTDADRKRLAQETLVFAQ